ncbi:hypothetical protein DFH08DRAFT_828045 [Mycena albidolilacea]|uniref:Uncharacterized protein n=1 Tax=Mycena albidolilacea TaxID=1033008 RepID=A0AAD6YXK7_9AGAR|nr:hypothetical protein DFH08DRAFT_828045 [Mycena albidolilacea]
MPDRNGWKLNVIVISTAIHTKPELNSTALSTNRQPNLGMRTAAAVSSAYDKCRQWARIDTGKQLDELPPLKGATVQNKRFAVDASAALCGGQNSSPARYRQTPPPRYRVARKKKTSCIRNFYNLPQNFFSNLSAINTRHKKAIECVQGYTGESESKVQRNSCLRSYLRRLEQLCSWFSSAIKLEISAVIIGCLSPPLAAFFVSIFVVFALIRAVHCCTQKLTMVSSRTLPEIPGSSGSPQTNNIHVQPYGNWVPAGINPADYEAFEGQVIGAIGSDQGASSIFEWPGNGENMPAPRLSCDCCSVGQLGALQHFFQKQDSYFSKCLFGNVPHSVTNRLSGTYWPVGSHGILCEWID